MSPKKQKKYTSRPRFTSCIMTYVAEEDCERLRAEAERRGISLAALVRDLIQPIYATLPRPGDAPCQVISPS
jgi:predicted HicB family RNase H-like nuclease